MLKIPEAWIQQIYQHAENEYPHECCGLLLAHQKDPQTLTRIIPCRNVQDDYHQQDPTAFPRTARQAYCIDPGALLEIQKSMRQTSEIIRVIYHSHIDMDAYFSEEDKRLALCNGEPVYPGADYLVLSVRNAKVVNSHLFIWDPLTKSFVF